MIKYYIKYILFQIVRPITMAALSHVKNRKEAKTREAIDTVRTDD